MHKRAQKNRWTSSWTPGDLIKRHLFVLTWALTCSWTPKKIFLWRNLILRLFGAQIQGNPFVASSARIHFPWKLILADRACISERVDVYTLDIIEIGARAVIAKDSFLCCGSHDFDSPNCELIVAPISIAPDAFIGARSILLPGCNIGRGTIIGAGSVVTKSMPAHSIAAGNPARVVRMRFGQQEIGNHED